MFSGVEVGSDEYYNELRMRFLEIFQNAIRDLLQHRKRVMFKGLLSLLEIPMTYESDIQQYLWDLKKKDLIGIEGMTSRERVIKENHVIIWKE